MDENICTYCGMEDIDPGAIHDLYSCAEHLRARVAGLETDLETEEQLGVIYREQLAGVPGDTMQQQIDWLLERAGVDWMKDAE